MMVDIFGGQYNCPLYHGGSNYVTFVVPSEPADLSFNDKLLVRGSRLCRH